ncbi:hypothetical protein [Epilithonimonas vandammei]|uniref:hypothetical protein n=1 Tax=Epilithonimonas vandammei TaxID=2487072 RepID=UPI0028A20DF2|nr:hypothetical protein [Epilithonimonas vandammei]
MENRTEMIKFRIEKCRKDRWKKLCSERGIFLTDLIISSVENRLMNNDRREILHFIETQDNIFVKIETNINQIAKIVNTQKFISEEELLNFNLKLEEIANLKNEQNKIFSKIFGMLANLK